MSFLPTRNGLSVSVSSALEMGQPRRSNVFAGAQVAYSTRIPAGSAYSGPLIRVRRSSDNAESDFGAVLTADSNGDRWLDDMGLLGFVGSGSGFVTTWYDQSGNGRNAVQATAGNQPSVVNAGVVATSNGRPAIVWDSTGTLELRTALPFASYPTSINTVVSILTQSASKGVFAMTGNDNGVAICVGNTAATNYGRNIIGLKGGVAWMPTNGTLTVGASKILTLIVPQGSASSAFFGDGSALTITAGATAVPATPTGSFWIGGHPMAATRLQQASISEVLCFSDIFSQRVRVERSQGAAFGITIS